jgi:hypothetical protein
LPGDFDLDDHASRARPGAGLIAGRVKASDFYSIARIGSPWCRDGRLARPYEPSKKRVPHIMFWEDSTSCNLQLSQNGQHLLVFTTWNDNSE